MPDKPAAPPACPECLGDGHESCPEIECAACFGSGELVEPKRHAKIKLMHAESRLHRANKSVTEEQLAVNLARIARDQLDTKEEESEIEYYRRKRGVKAACVAGPLLDAWDALPRDVKGMEELAGLPAEIQSLRAAMDIESWPDAEEYKPNKIAEPGRLSPLARAEG